MVMLPRFGSKRLAESALLVRSSAPPTPPLRLPALGPAMVCQEKETVHVRDRNTRVGDRGRLHHLGGLPRRGGETVTGRRSCSPPTAGQGLPARPGADGR